MSEAAVAADVAADTGATVIAGADDSQAMALANGVMETIVAIAVADVEGVVGLGGGARRKLFSAKPAQPVVEVTMEGDEALVAVHLTVKYGTVLPEMAAAVRQAVADALAAQVGLAVKRVDIFVDAVTF